MSDQNAGGTGDFRSSAADKRKDETVMVNADDLSNLVSSARQEPPAPVAPVAPPYQPPAAIPATSGPPVAIIAAVLGVIALIIVVALIIFLAR